jgi:uncharacterized protein YjbI with pentapeptide repeats
MSQRKTVTTQQEFTDLVLLGERITNTDFTFNMAIGAMHDFPADRTIIFVNCTFKSVSIQMQRQSIVSFKQCRFERLQVGEAGVPVLLELIDSVVLSITFHNGAYSDYFKISRCIIDQISFSERGPKSLAISNATKIGQLIFNGVQAGLDTISITDSEIADVFMEYTKVSNQFTIKTELPINTVKIYSSEFNDFLIKALVSELLIEGDGVRTYNINRLTLSKAAQHANSNIKFNRVDFTTLDLTTFVYKSQFTMSEITISDMVLTKAKLTNISFNNVSINRSLSA